MSHIYWNSPSCRDTLLHNVSLFITTSDHIFNIYAKISKSQKLQQKQKQKQWGQVDSINSTILSKIF